MKPLEFCAAFSVALLAAGFTPRGAAADPVGGSGGIEGGTIGNEDVLADVLYAVADRRVVLA